MKYSNRAKVISICASTIVLSMASAFAAGYYLYLLIN
jgi:hypothetical protein